MHLKYENKIDNNVKDKFWKYFMKVLDAKVHLVDI